MQNSVTEYLWLHRVKRLLNICILQLSIPLGSQALPLRLLETLTAVSVIERHVENEQLVQYYLERVFTYLIKHNYYKHLRQLMEQKCPPLNAECLSVPNPFLEAIMQLILRPLLIHTASDTNIVIIYGGFVKHILSAPFSEAIRYFLIPNLANHNDFPFERLINTLPLWIKQSDGQKVTSVIPDVMNTTVASETLSKASTSPGKSYNSSLPSTTLTSARLLADEVSQQIIPFNGFILESLLILDRKQLSRLDKRISLL